MEVSVKGLPLDELALGIAQRGLPAKRNAGKSFTVAEAGHRLVRIDDRSVFP